MSYNILIMLWCFLLFIIFLLWKCG